jgi:hypothetical protein
LLAYADVSSLTTSTTLRVRLFDTLINPVPGAAYRAIVQGNEQWGTADADAIAVLTGISAPARVTLAWGPLPDDAQASSAHDERYLVYALDLVVLAPGPAGDDRLREQLNALGYPREAPLDECVRHFQHDYGLQENGDPTDNETTERAAALYAAMNPQARSAPDSPYQSLFDSEGP